MRILSVLIFLFSSTVFACDNTEMDNFIPYALSEGKDKYKVVFPISDLAKEPMYISGMDLIIDNVVKAEIQYLKDNGIAIAYINIAPTLLGATTIVGSYNFGNEEGTIMRLCANWKAFKLKDLLSNGGNV